MATAVFDRVRVPAFEGILGESLGEFLGTMVLILFGDGCVAGVLLFGAGGVTNGGLSVPLWTNWVVIALGWGLAVMLGVYVAGTLSGAHLNPAVSIGFAVAGRFPWVKVAPYIVAQVLGAFVAALILWAVYHGAFLEFEKVHHIARGINTPNGTTEAAVFYTFKKPFLDVFPGAFFDELVGTALLVGLIFAIVDIRNAPPESNLGPFVIGMLVVAIGLSFGYNTGYAINPARDFGPRLLAWFAGFKDIALPGPDNYFWVPIIGPIIGGIVGAITYELTIHQALLARRVAPVVGVEEIGELVRDQPGRDE